MFWQKLSQKSVSARIMTKLTSPLDILSPPAVEEQSIVISMSVCVAECLSVCEHISETASPNFTIFSRHFANSLWRHYSTLYTSSFVDDVVFSYHCPNGSVLLPQHCCAPANTPSGWCWLSPVQDDGGYLRARCSGAEFAMHHCLVFFAVSDSPRSRLKLLLPLILILSAQMNPQMS